MSINAQPFNPTFKLIGNLAADQVLTYDVSENAFVNSAGSGGASVTGFTTAVNQGATGESIFDTAGSTLQFKSFIGGTDITITDNGTALVINSTLTETLQTGTNLGTGSALYSTNNASNQLQFKSLAVGAGLIINDDGNGTLTLVNTVAGGGTAGADTTLSNLADVATARTNLGVLSTTQADIKYLRTDASTIPQTNNAYDIGQPDAKYNDVYAETFHGTAVLADDLTVSGTTGQVLTYDGSSWTAADSSGGGTLSSASDMSTVAPADGQHLVWDTGTSLWTPGSAGTGGGGYQDSDARASISAGTGLLYVSSTGVMTLSASISNLADVDTTGISPGEVLKWNGSSFIGGADTNVDTTYTAGTNVSISAGNVISSTDTNTTYTNLSEFTNDSGYITSVPAQTFASITGTPTTIAGYGITDAFDSSSAFPYSNVTGTPTIPTLTSQLTNDAGFITTAGTYANSDVDTHLNTSTATTSQVLSWTGTDYDWITSTDLNTTYTAGTGLTLTGTTFSLTAAHFDGNYNSLTNKPTALSSFTNDAGFLTAQTDSQTLTLSGNTLAITGGNSVTLATPISTIDDLDDVTISSTSDGQFLQYNNTSGDWENVTISLYADADVNAHLNTSTATANQVLTWTGTDYDWISSGAHFDGNYSSLVGAPTLPTLVSHLTNDSGFITSVPAQTFASLTSKPTTLAGYGITDAIDTDTTYTAGANVSISVGNVISSTDTNTDTNTEYTAGTGLTLSGTTFSLTGSHFDGAYSSLTGAPALFDGAYSSLTSTPTTLAGYGITDSYTNSHVDAHLNNGGSVSNGYILSWNGSDYNWIANSGTPAWANITNKPTSIAGYGITDTFFSGAFSALTSKPTTLAGYGITDATDTNTTYTAGTGLTLTGTEFTLTAAHFDGAYASLSGKPTIPTAVSALTNDSGFITSVPAQSFSSLTSKPTTIAGYGITDRYANAEVDAHLNQSNPTAGHVLFWNGTDYAWKANGISQLTGLNDVTLSGTDGGQFLVYNIGTADWENQHVNISDLYNVSSTAPSSGQVLKWSGTEWAPAAQTFASLTSKPTTLAGYGITDSFSGSYTDLTNKPTIPSALTDLSISDGTNGQVLTTNGSGAFTFTTVSGGGGGATDKIEEGNSSVEVIDGGANGHIMFNTNASDRWQVSNSGHILPEATETYDIGSASKKVRHLYLSDNSLYIGADTLRTQSSNLLFNSEDVQDYTNLKNIPTPFTGGTGIQVNSGVISLTSASLDTLSNVSSTAPTTGQVLKWTGSTWAPGTDLTSGSSAMNDLSDVDTSGIASGQFLKWNGTAFVAATVSGGGASAINDLSDVDTTTSAPSNGDVLTWNTSDSEWAPSAPAAGGGSGATIEMFKLNYATNGNLTSVTNTTSGLSATITSATGGTVDITFSSTSYPPANMLMYGYAYASNKYVVKPVSGDMSTKEVTGGGSSGSPIAFGSMSSVKLTLKLREADTGASRSFGTTTHAWLMFTTV
jgi:hypothetical protein